MQSQKMNKNDKKTPFSRFFLVYRLMVLCSYLNSGICVPWEKDPATGNQYVQLNTLFTLDEMNLTQACKDQNAKLPEPRGEEENAFLHRLINDIKAAVLLGLNSNDGGVWRWNSDNSRVTWFNWKRPPKNTRKMCVVFNSRTYPKAWINVKCKNLSRRFKKKKKILICQRSVSSVKCGRTCMNGGHCLAEGFCRCANGFYGDGCEYSATWIKDWNSGKLYAHLYTTVYSWNEATQRCLKVGGKLPEPRGYYENRFLGSLGIAKTFFLGMTKRNGYWIWNSDGSRVYWTIWWPVRGWQYCAYMLRNTVQASARLDRMRWSSVDCWRHDVPRTTVCEKK